MTGESTWADVEVLLRECFMHGIDPADQYGKKDTQEEQLWRHSQNGSCFLCRFGSGKHGNGDLGYMKARAFSLL